MLRICPLALGYAYGGGGDSVGSRGSHGTQCEVLDSMSYLVHVVGSSVCFLFPSSFRQGPVT